MAGRWKTHPGWAALRQKKLYCQTFSRHLIPVWECKLDLFYLPFSIFFPFPRLPGYSVFYLQTFNFYLQFMAGHSSGFLCHLYSSVEMFLPPLRDSSCDAFIEKQSHPICLCNVKVKKSDCWLSIVLQCTDVCSKPFPTTTAASNSLYLRKHFLLVCKFSWIFTNM